MDDLSKPTLAFVILTTAVIACLCLYLGFYAQPILDDFCFGHDVAQYNSIFDYLTFTWEHLNGRWATNSLRYGFYQGIGIGEYYWLTVPLSIACIFLGFWFCSSSYISSYKIRALLTAIFATIFISICSKISSLVFWGSSFIDYTLGYFLVYASLAMVFTAIKLASPWLDWRYYVAPIFVGISCGLSELFIIPVWAFIIGLFIFSDKRWYLLPVIVFMVIGSGFSLLAPGNMVRSGNVEAELQLVNVLYETSLYGLRGLLLPCIALYLLSHIPFIKQPVSLASQLAEKNIPANIRKLIAAFAFLYPFAVIFILEIALGSPGPGRAHNLSLFFLIFTWPIIISTCQFLKPKQYHFAGFNCLMCLLGVVVLIGVNNKDLIEDAVSGDAVTYHGFVSQAKQILSAPENKQQDVVLTISAKKPNIAPGSPPLVTIDQNYWGNKCVALYYDLKSVRYNKK